MIGMEGKREAREAGMGSGGSVDRPRGLPWVPLSVETQPTDCYQTGLPPPKAISSRTSEVPHHFLHQACICSSQQAGGLTMIVAQPLCLNWCCLSLTDLRKYVCMPLSSFYSFIKWRETGEPCYYLGAKDIAIVTWFHSLSNSKR